MSDTEVIHIAGMSITIGTLLRQRCAWCGALILDEDLSRVAVMGTEDGVEFSLPVWPPGGLVACLTEEGSGVTWSVDFDPIEDPLPERCCGNIDPEVTR